MSGHHHHHHHELQVPQWVLIATAVLLMVTFAFAVFSRTTGIGRTEMPEARVVESRSLVFEHSQADVIEVVDHATGDVLVTAGPGEQGFLRGLLRSLRRGRKLESKPMDEPYELIRWSDGRLSLHDPSIDGSIELDVFGRDNVALFKRLMETTLSQARG
ncbi:MAG: photosynthetic complex assembly protein PuhC [Myxococcota bacterium]